MPAAWPRPPETTSAASRAGGAWTASSRTLGLLGAVLLAKLLLEVAVLAAGFVSVAGDDFWRALIAHEWSKRPFVSSGEFATASVLWLPLPFWIVGSVLSLYRDLWLVPVVTNLVFSLGTVGLVYLLGQRLFGGSTGLVAAIVVAATPWHVWLSISGMAEVAFLFFLLGGVYCLVSWAAEPWAPFLALGVLALLLSTAVRPEGWFYAGFASAYLAWSAFRTWRTRAPLARAGLSLAAVAPWAFIVYWLVFNYAVSGHALHFLALSRGNYQSETGGIDTVWLRLVQFPLLMLVVSPLVTVLVVPGVVRAWKRARQDPALGLYVGAALGGVASLVVAGVFGLGTTSAPQRYVLPTLALLAPLAADRLVSWATHPRQRQAFRVGLTLFVVVSVLGAFRISQEFVDEVRLGRTLRTLWETGQLPRDALVCTERALVRLTGAPVTSRMRRQYLLVDRWALQVMSNHPDNFLDGGWTVRFEDEPRGAEALGACVDPSRDTTLVLKSKELIPSLPDRFQLGLRVGAYYVLTPAPERFTSVAPPPETSITTRTDANFGEGLRLLGYSVRPALLPQALVLAFELTAPARGGYFVDLRVVRASDDRPVFGTTYPLLRSDWPVPRGPDGNRRFQETVPLGRIFDVPVGHVFVDLRILDGQGAALSPPPGAPGQTVVRMGPLALTPGKREAIKQALRGNLASPVTLLAAIFLL